MNYWLKDDSWRLKVKDAIKGFKCEVNQDIVDAVKVHLDKVFDGDGLTINVYASTSAMNLEIVAGIHKTPHDGLYFIFSAKDLGMSKFKIIAE